MKKRVLKRITSIALATTMSFAMFNTNNVIPSLVENISITASAATYIASGTYSNLTWKIDSNGVLYITSTGTKIPDFTKGSAPWYSYRNQIKKISIPRDLQEIGNYAFYNLTNATNVFSSIGTPTASWYCYLPTSLKRIGKGAFYNCSSLKGTNNTDLMIGVAYSGLQNDLTIEKDAFSKCSALKKLWLQSSTGKSVTIGYGAFTQCGLTSLDFDVDHVTLDQRAFFSCYDLSTVRIEINAKMNESAFLNTDFYPYSKAVGYPTGGSYDSKKGWAEKVGALTNKERKIRGIHPLKYSTAMSVASHVRAEEQRYQYAPHTRPDGRVASSALWDIGLDYLAAENCAEDWSSPSSAVSAWMSSTTGHRETLLSTEYNYLGCGFAGDTTLTYYSGKNYWQQFFVYTRDNLEGYTVIAR